MLSLSGVGIKPMVTAREAEALLQGLLEQYSPSRRESGAVVYLVRRMAELGFQAWVEVQLNHK